MTDFGARTTAEDASAGIDLSGRHAVVTGANTGIGWETARVLALRGASVTLACRDAARADAARERILERHPGVAADALQVRPLDLASLDSVRSFAEDFLSSGLPIHLLVNNAGVMLNDYRETADGFELHLGVNHLGHFLLTTLLQERIRESAPARVVVVSSDAHQFATLTSKLEDLNWDERPYRGMRAYGDSKLMNILFANELDRRMRNDGVSVNSLHPGIVATELGRDQRWYMKLVGLLALPVVKPPERGAATTVYLATRPEASSEGHAPGGGYYSNCSLAKRVHRLAGDEKVASLLWDWSEETTRA